MNEFVMTKQHTAVRRERKPARLRTLTNAAIISAGLGVCGLRFDARLALLAFGVSAMLAGMAAFYSSRRVSALTLGTVLALLGGTLTVWGIVLLLGRQTLTLPVHHAAVQFALQLLFLAAGLVCIFLPLLEIARIRRFYTNKVAAECVQTRTCILWRYRYDGCIYDHAEPRCRSFFIPQTGERCILHIDPLAPERACRLDRVMTAMQITAGLMLLTEAVLSLWNMTGGITG